MDPVDRRVRHFVYDHIATHATPPSLEDIAQDTGRSAEDIRQSLSRLEASHALALAPSSGSLWMLHPFSGVPTSFRFDTNERSYFGNCAWDVLAIGALLKLDGRVPARCAESGERIDLTLERGALSSQASGVVHFVVPPRRFWENVGYT